MKKQEGVELNKILAQHERITSAIDQLLKNKKNEILNLIKENEND